MGRYDGLAGVLMRAGVGEATDAGLEWTADLFALLGESHRLMGFGGNKVWTADELQAAADWVNERERKR